MPIGDKNDEKLDRRMHELFMQVLKNRDLSRAGDLFSVPDSIIVSDLTNVLHEITSIASLADYANNDNDQSVVEICITRVTSCIRETGTIEQHCEALVTLLESCLHHNLQVSSRDEDPPHAKISSDIISCIFLNYSKKSVMQRALPVAVKFLHKGNKELSRNMASYLSLAAMEHASLLTPHVQPIMDSIISGNYPLCRVLPNIYEVSPEPFQGHAMALVSLLSHCDNQEKLALLNLFSLMAKDNPSLLEASVPQLCEYLTNSVTAAPTLQIFLNMAEKQPALLADHVNAMKQSAQRHPQTVCLAAQVISAVGKLSKDRAQDALNFVLEYLPKADRGSQSTLLREATLLCSSYPVLFTDKVLAGVRQRHHTSTNQITPTTNQVMSGGVTIVKVGGAHQQAPPTPVSSAPPTGYTRRAKLGDSRSTGRLHTAQNTNHRSMTRLNVAGGSVGGLHKSMTRLSSSREINTTPSHSTAIPTPNVIVTNTSKWSGSNVRVSSGGVTVTTISPPRMQRPLSQGPLTLLSNHSTQLTPVVHTPPPPHSVTVSSVYTGPPMGGHVSVSTGSGSSGAQTIAVAPGPPPEMLGGSTSIHSTSGSVNVTGPTTVISRRNTSVTLINQNIANQRISVFEPYPMRDTIQHFCEKHLDKIKIYMEKVSLRIPSPAKCTIEEKRQKKLAKLHFVCQVKGQHCLYSKTYFTMRTRNPRIWIHLMFISLQARNAHALSSRDAQVASLKHCWDMLKSENKTFLTVVTGAFPCAKDQDTLLNELRHSGYFDVFQVCPPGVGESENESLLPPGHLIWGCFLCVYPERAVGFLRGDTQPVIEGQLKEKKGRWRLFRRWRTRYFTLSGAHLSCRGSKRIPVSGSLAFRYSHGKFKNLSPESSKDTRADYWKSQERKYCDFCKCWIADNKPSRDFHENGRRHRENVKKRLKTITKNSAKDQRDSEKVDASIRAMEAAALEAYRRDVENNADLTSIAINKKVQDNNLEINIGSKKLWQEAKTRDGKSYYWNSMTNETVWTPPEEGYLSVKEQREQKDKEAATQLKEWDKLRQKEGLLKLQQQQKEEDEEKARQAREKMKERRVKEDSPEPVYGPILEPGKNDPYGRWQTVKESEPVVDLQLPHQEYFEIPVVAEPEPLVKEFKEKTVESLEEYTETDFKFKKRKIMSGVKRNTRQRLDID